LRKTIQQHPALNETFKAAADKQLRLTRKDLETAAPAPPTEADVHYCTGRMRAEKLRELAELNCVTIPANSREIETARQEGDLRENAGYHAAKDKQKMLMQQTLQLQQALSITRVITAQNVRTDAIGFGTTFEADNLASGKTESFTVLGRWEADPEKHILSYLAPMVQQFLGKKAGDEIVIKHPGGGETPYRILSISNALASGEWDVKEE
ncbi:GreA/GreB family elongation factor, partial [Candidatus Sumerlaeota bacterium]|nr:GreA/GreB family elongation factor [Candidatus Sumerlaeota bacterium]